MNTQSISRIIRILDRISPAPENRIPFRREPGPDPDRNFYEDEEELAMELSAAAPARLIFPCPPAIEADEFEASYQWFLA